MTSSSAARCIAGTALILALSGCSMFDGWFGGKEEPPLPGERIAVLSTERLVSVDPTLGGTPAPLPAAVSNSEWPQAGGGPTHSVASLALGETLKRAWTADIGEGSDRGRRILAQPIVAGGRVYALDGSARVTAVNAENGERTWSVDLTPKGAEGGFGGGLAYANGQILAATGYGQIVALDPSSGKEIWRRSVRTPVRGAPTVAEGRVFSITLDNRLEVTDAATGNALWTHSGIAETTSLLGHSSPAVSEGVVIVPYSSGELFALRSETGRMLWSDSLTSIRRADVVSDLADIRALPVISGNVVFAVGHSGRSAALDLRTGNRIWEQDFGGVNMPWVAGDTIFLVTTESQLLAAQTSDGRVRWASLLPAFVNPERKEQRISWAGPVLAGGRLVLTNSQGQAVFFSPFSGEKLGELQLPAPSTVSPVVAGQTLYVLSEDATLSAFR